MLVPLYDVPAPHTFLRFHPDLHLFRCHRLSLSLRLHFHTVRRPGQSGVLLVPAPRPLALYHPLRVLVLVMHRLFVTPNSVHVHAS